MEFIINEPNAKVTVARNYLDSNLTKKLFDIANVQETQSIDAPRRISFACGNKEFVDMKYSICIVKPWIDELLELKNDMNKQFNADFNMCLLQYYPDGSYGIDFHSDGKSVIEPVCIISLGVSREFIFKHNSGLIAKTTLNDGDLLVMSGSQLHLDWVHGIEPDTAISGMRISISMRTLTMQNVKSQTY